MRKIIPVIGTVLTLASPIVTVACFQADLAKEVSEVWNLNLSAINEFQDKKSLGWIESSVFKLAIPIEEESDSIVARLFDGPSKINQKLWNQNPTASQISNHFSKFSVSEQSIRDSFDLFAETFAKASEHFDYFKMDSEKVETENFLLAIDAAIASINQIDANPSLGAYQIAVNEINSGLNSYVDATITDGNKSTFDIKQQLPWGFKQYTLKENISDVEEFTLLAEIIINQTLQVALESRLLLITFLDLNTFTAQNVGF